MSNNQEKNRRPAGYWNDYGAVLTEARCIYLTYGHIPQNRILYKEGKSSFCAAVARHGGIDKVKQDIGIEQDKPASYYKDIDHARAKIAELVKELGHFPTQSELDERKECEFRRGVQEHHNGLRGLREKLGYESDMRPRGHWKVWKRIDEGLDEVIHERGHFPSYTELREDNPGLLKGMETHHGGYNAVRKKKGYALSRKESGHWGDKETMHQELKTFMKRHTLKEIPNSTFLTEHGASSLASAIWDHGGFRALRKEFGEEVPKTRKQVEAELGEPLRQFFTREYEDNHRSMKELGPLVGVNPVTIGKWLKEEGMHVRSISEARLPKGVALPTKEELARLYWDKGKSTPEIGVRYGVSSYTVGRWLKKQGIKMKDSSERARECGSHKPTKDNLIREYQETGMNQKQLGTKYGVAPGTIGNWLEEYGIPIRDIRQAQLPFGFREPSKAELESWYVQEERTLDTIGKEIGVSKSTVRGLLEKHTIPIAGGREAVDKKKPEREELIRYYTHERRTPVDIGKEVGVCGPVVERWLKEYDIPTRTHSEARLKKGGRVPSEEELRTWYVEQGKTTVAIAELVGTSDVAVGMWLEQQGIARRDKRGMYDTKETRMKTFQELLTLSGKKPEELSSRDFDITKRPDGMSFAGLLNWYRRNTPHKQAPTRDYVLLDLAGLPLGSTIYAERAKPIKKKGLEKWEDFEKALDKIFEKHPELEHKLPSGNWFSDHGYPGIEVAALKMHGGMNAVREKLGQEIIRQSNGHWKEFGNVVRELEKIVGEHPELEGNLPSSSWLSEHRYTGLINGMQRNHGGYVKVQELLRVQERQVGSLLEEYVNGE